MVFLVRKIEEAKWRQKPILTGCEVSADAITGSSLKTKSNTLSVWEIEDENSINEAFLAIASVSDHIETFEVALLPAQSVTNAGLSLIETDGITLVDDLKKTHRDISNLDYQSIGLVKNIVVEAFKKDLIRRITKKQLITLLRTAINSGRIEKESLKEDVKKYLN